MNRKWGDCCERWCFVKKLFESIKFICSSFVCTKKYRPCHMCVEFLKIEGGALHPSSTCSFPLPTATLQPPPPPSTSPLPIGGPGGRGRRAEGGSRHQAPMVLPHHSCPRAPNVYDRFRPAHLGPVGKRGRWEKEGEVNPPPTLSACPRRYPIPGQKPTHGPPNRGQNSAHWMVARHKGTSNGLTVRLSAHLRGSGRVGAYLGGGPRFHRKKLWGFREI